MKKLTDKSKPATWDNANYIVLMDLKYRNCFIKANNNDIRESQSEGEYIDYRVLGYAHTSKEARYMMLKG